MPEAAKRPMARGFKAVKQDQFDEEADWLALVSAAKKHGLYKIGADDKPYVLVPVDVDPNVEPDV